MYVPRYKRFDTKLLRNYAYSGILSIERAQRYETSHTSYSVRLFSFWGLLLHVLLPLAISRSRRRRLFPKAVPHDSTMALIHDYVR